MADGTKKRGGGGIFTLSNLLKIPASLGTLRSFMDAVNWNAAEADVKADLQRTIIITGLPNTGKSTLFNKLQGKYRSVVSATPGTTRSLISGLFGPFTLVDTPGHLQDVQESGAREASVILLLLDATASLRPEEITLFARLSALKRPIVVAMNKADLVRGNPEARAAEIATALGVPDVIPISAITGANIAPDLIPALIDASPKRRWRSGVNCPNSGGRRRFD